VNASGPRRSVVKLPGKRRRGSARFVLLGLSFEGARGRIGGWGGLRLALFRVLEGFPDLAHDDEVDTCSGALEMLNVPIKGAAMIEYYRLRAQEFAEQRKPQPAPPNPAPGSLE